MILLYRNDKGVLAAFRFGNKRGTAPHGVGKVRMGSNRDEDGVAGGGEDATLIAKCAAFHTAFERETAARQVSDEESNRFTPRRHRGHFGEYRGKEERPKPPPAPKLLKTWRPRRDSNPRPQD